MIRLYMHLILQATSRNVIIGSWLWGLEIFHSCGKPCFADDAHSLAGQAYVTIYRMIALLRVKLMLALDGSLLKRK
jgi:hypothetical protein